MSNRDTSTPEVVVAVEGGVAQITIDRPARLNALSRAVFAKLASVFVDCDQREDVRVIVLTGAGERAFCAGVDLKDEGFSGTRMVHPMRAPDRNLNEIVLESTKPTIAAINGVAAGGGCELALACDIRIAASHARIGLPEAKVGMGANFGSVMLPRLISRGVAMELLFTGELVDMNRAYEIGLVNRFVDISEFRSVVRQLAASIAENAPLSVKRMKSVAFRSMGLSPSAGLRLESQFDPYRSSDRLEGAQAFAEKRKPRFKGE